MSVIGNDCMQTTAYVVQSTNEFIPKMQNQHGAIAPSMGRTHCQRVGQRSRNRNCLPTANQWGGNMLIGTTPPHVKFDHHQNRSRNQEDCNPNDRRMNYFHGQVENSALPKLRRGTRARTLNNNKPNPYQIDDAQATSSNSEHFSLSTLDQIKASISGQKRVPVDESAESSKKRRTESDSKRGDNSLFTITRRFIDLLVGPGSVDLNWASRELNVLKRRLYDVTNVMESIGLVKKVGKNSVAFVLRDDPAECGVALVEVQKIEKENEKLRNLENHLDNLISELHSRLTLIKEEPTERSYHYIEFGILRNLEDFRVKSLIALATPPGSISNLILSERDSKRLITINTANKAEIKAFLCPKAVDHAISEAGDMKNSGTIETRIIDMPVAPQLSDRILGENGNNDRHFLGTHDPYLNSAGSSKFKPTREYYSESNNMPFDPDISNAENILHFESSDEHSLLSENMHHLGMVGDGSSDLFLMQQLQETGEQYSNQILPPDFASHCQQYDSSSFDDRIYESSQNEKFGAHSQQGDYHLREFSAEELSPTPGPSGLQNSANATGKRMSPSSISPLKMLHYDFGTTGDEYYSDLSTSPFMLLPPVTPEIYPYGMEENSDGAYSLFADLQEDWQ